MAKVARGKVLVAKLRAQAGVRDPEALAAYLGRFKKARKAGRSVAEAAKVARGDSAGKPSTAPSKSTYSKNLTATELNRWALGAFKESASLSTEETERLRRYQSAGYQRINPYLRGRINPSDKGEIKKSVAAIDAVMKRSRTPEDITVLRAMNGSAFGDLDLDHIAGKTFADDGYQSTALKNKPPHDFKSKRVVMNLHVPKGTPAVYLSGVATDRRMKAEQEVLLDRGLKFKINAARYNPRSGKWVVDAEVVR